nr:C10 family peptidase [Bacteroidota bacterium]
MRLTSYILLILFPAFLTLSTSAEVVDLNTAKNAAINHYYERYNQNIAHLDYYEIEVGRIYTHTISDMPAFYAFDFKGGGFAIISAEDALLPVIGYSFNGQFQANPDLNTNYGSLIQRYAEEVAFVRNTKKVAGDNVKAAWDFLLNNTPGQLNVMKDERSVSPMLSSLWAQGTPYNLMCPEDPGGSGGHVVTGCGATSMSQIMHYWRYPKTGTGSHSYYASGYGLQTANFGETNYNWTGMLNSCDNENPFPTAELNYHAGVSIDMNYGPTGSGAQPGDVDNAFRDYFRYADAQYFSRSNYSQATWTNLLKEQLDLEQPVLYIGYNDAGGGHAFVCDGYQDDDFFHFNFGWGGQANGYYTLGDIYGFHVDQNCVMNLYPTDSDYPYFQNDTDTIVEFSGSITDGSGPAEDYPNNTSAGWLIDPQTDQDSVSSITITFYQFATAENDLVTIYDGASVSAAILGTYSGNSVPPTLTSTGNQVLITFTSNENETAPGWYLEFNANRPEYCSGLTVLSEPSGTLTDGSGSFNYNNQTICMWKIEPEWATEITLYFTEFDTESVSDLIRIFDGSSLIGEYSGDEIPDPVVAYSGSMFIAFLSNETTTLGGWEAYYETDNVGIPDQKGYDNLFNIYPNPADEMLNITFENAGGSQFKIEIVSLSGSIVFSETLDDNNRFINKPINISKLQGGVYLIKLVTEKYSFTRRVVIW